MEKNIAGELTQRSRLEHDDELNHPEYPGETQAVQEVLGVNRLRLRRSPNLTFGSWAVFGE
jgi:hypothetical protein